MALDLLRRHTSNPHRSSRLPISTRRRLSFQAMESRRLLAVVQLEPVADNTLYQDDFGSLSNGSGAHLFAGRVAGRGGATLRRGLLRFDLASIPEGATINSVSVALTASRTISGGSDVSLHAALGDWGEGSSVAPGQEGTGTTATDQDATWLHKMFPSSMWSSPGGDFSATASATVEVGSNGRYTWSSTGLVNDVESWLANPGSNFGWVIIGDEQTVGSAKRFDTRENSVAANRPNLIIDYDVPAMLDFGDAPTASQSGLEQSYPTLLADNGARHSPSDLHLGSAIDSELDGAPSASAGGDGADEDGITFLGSLVAAASSTTTSLMANVSSSGKLDGWIDLNRDGDWQDAGEQIFSSVDVTAGDNLLSFTVGPQSSAGTTYARFRLSSTGGLAPTGLADDGEVEDYSVEILNGAESHAVFVTIAATGQPVELTFGESELTMHTGLLETMRVPAANVGSMTVNGGDADDVLIVDYESGSSAFSGSVTLEGGGGGNSLQIAGNAGPLDLSSPSFQASDFDNLQIAFGTDTVVTINSESIRTLAPSLGRVRVQTDQGERIVFSDLQNWRMSSPISSGGQFYVTATEQNTGEVVEAATETLWQNLVNAYDVNNDGIMSPLDALAVINDLAREAYILDGNVLVNPASLSSWPGRYIDTNGDGRATPLDALRVINRLALVQTGQSEGEMPNIQIQSLSVPGDSLITYDQALLALSDERWRLF